MADYNGTDEDDIIDASTLDSDVGRIYPGKGNDTVTNLKFCLLYTSPSPRDQRGSRMPSSA